MFVPPLDPQNQAWGRVAKPGDAGLDADMSVQITAIVEESPRVVLVGLDDGDGWFVDQDTRVPVRSVLADGTMRVAAPDMADTAWRELMDRLERWRSGSVTVRLTVAAGQMTLLIDRAQNFVLLPPS